MCSVVFLVVFFKTHVIQIGLATSRNFPSIFSQNVFTCSWSRFTRCHGDQQSVENWVLRSVRFERQQFRPPPLVTTWTRRRLELDLLVATCLRHGTVVRIYRWCWGLWGRKVLNANTFLFLKQSLKLSHSSNLLICLCLFCLFMSYKPPLKKNSNCGLTPEVSKRLHSTVPVPYRSAV